MREAKTSALRATHIYNWNRRGSINSLHQTEKPEGVCVGVGVFKAFQLHWPNKHICTPMEICYKHTIERQFLLVQYEKKSPLLLPVPSVMSAVITESNLLI